MQINAMPKVQVRASELLTKFRHREDRYNFCRERSKNIINNFKAFIFRMKIILTRLFFYSFFRESKK